MVQIIWVASVVLLAGYINAEIRISLNSDASIYQWTVKNESSSDRIWATVPGGIYSDLQLVDKLFYDLNDLKYGWVGMENWTYETPFELSKDVLDKAAVNLVFHGIDTIGEVYVNGKHVQSVNNMFVRYVIPIKQVAKEGVNSLEVRLKSPIIAARELAEANGYEIPPNCTLNKPYGDCHINFIRKMQASFGWDWAPNVPSVGIWKAVEIEAFDSAIVRNVATTIREENGTWYFDIECHCEGIKQDYGYITKLSQLPSNPKLSNLQASNIKNTTSVKTRRIMENYSLFTFKTTTDFPVNQTEAWWPNGYGKQPRWNLTCELLKFSPDGLILERSSRSTVTALRTIELVQQESENPKDGLSFYFKVNNEPIFAKGANWIPSHILPELAAEEKTIRKLLQSAKDANMNMLRVSGSGIYESDLFYEIADELGVLIWQDMMFTSSLYPAYKEFLDSVAMEVAQQVKRLKAHPSVVLYNGNSDIENILATNRFHIENTTYYVQDYNTLFTDTIKPVVQKLDPSRWYATSSPSNGLKTEDGHISENPNDSLYGDVHYFNYDINPWNMASYNNGKFISEYGFQSMPSFYSISKAFKEEDLSLGSAPSKSRQHFENGYDIMQKLIKTNLPLRPNDESQTFYEEFIHYSQIMQAMATKIETEKYRVQRMSGNSKGTMGTLYSQLNDVWQAPTWSSIEYGGKWKMLHYYAAKFFAPVIVVPYLLSDGDTLRIYGVSDLRGNDTCDLIMSIYSWDSFVPKHTTTNTFLLRGSSSNLLLEFSLSLLLNTIKCDNKTCFMYFKLKGDRFSADNFLFLSSLSDAKNLQPATLHTSVRQGNKKNEAFIDITTDQITPFVWLEADLDGTFSDNGFTQVSESKTISFRNREEGASIDIGKLRSTLKIKSLLQRNGAAGLACSTIVAPLLITFFSYIKKLW